MDDFYYSDDDEQRVEAEFSEGDRRSRAGVTILGTSDEDRMGARVFVPAEALPNLVAWLQIAQGTYAHENTAIPAPRLGSDIDEVMRLAGITSAG